MAPPPVEPGWHAGYSATREIPVAIGPFRDWFLSHAMIGYLKRAGRISPPVAATSLSGGDWPAPDAVHRLTLEDGHKVTERVLAMGEGGFRYQGFGFTAPGARVLRYVVGEFAYVPVSPRVTRLGWTYLLRPKTLLAAPLVWLAARTDFRHFMEQGLDDVVAAARRELG